MQIYGEARDSCLEWNIGCGLEAWERDVGVERMEIIHEHDLQNF